MGIEVEELELVELVLTDRLGVLVCPNLPLVVPKTVECSLAGGRLELIRVLSLII